MWKQALNICRLAQSVILWSTLAALSSKKNQFNISEEAYSNALQIDKVDYLQYIKALDNSSPEQMAEKSMLNGRISEAEIILLHSKKISEAIFLCIRMHRWERALEIAEKNNENIEHVLNERKKYMKILDRNENNSKFLNAMKKYNNRNVN